MAKEIKQRMGALFAVLGIAIFFWFSFHQNGTSLSLFARDFVKTDSIAPEIWQALNPCFVILLTPVIMWYFAALARRGKVISTPRKIAIGMGLAAVAYIFLTIVCAFYNYPSGEMFRNTAVAVREGMKTGPWVLILLYFFLYGSRAVYIAARPVVCLEGGSSPSAGPLSGSLARRDCGRQPPALDRPAHLQCVSHLAGMGHLRRCMLYLYGCHARYGEMARTRHRRKTSPQKIRYLQLN